MLMRENALSTTNKIGGVFHKQGHPQNSQQGQGWEETQVCDTLNAFDLGESRTPLLIVEIRDG